MYKFLVKHQELKEELFESDNSGDDEYLKE